MRQAGEKLYDVKTQDGILFCILIFWIASFFDNILGYFKTGVMECWSTGVLERNHEI